MTPTPPITDRTTFQRNLTTLRPLEKAHTRTSDALATARRTLPMVSVPNIPLIGAAGPTTLLSAFESRSQLLIYIHMWTPGAPFSSQCSGCTFFNGHVQELSYLHSRGVTFATLSAGPWEEISAYREFLGLKMPWYHVDSDKIEDIADGVLVAYLRVGDEVFQTYATTGRGCEVMANSYGLLDLTVFGRQEVGETSPEGWPQGFGGKGGQWMVGGRPILQVGKGEEVKGDEAVGDDVEEKE
ncbi:hypothetical protein OQA88_13261 [Cercophora sp. LCS_1]